jgi:hypothetical protein
VSAPVDGVLALDDLALGVGLAGLDEVCAAAGVQLQAVRALAVARRAHLRTRISHYTPTTQHMLTILWKHYLD